MKSIEVKGTARTIAERSSEQARALKEIRKNGGVPCVLYGVFVIWFILRISM